MALLAEIFIGLYVRGRNMEVAQRVHIRVCAFIYPSIHAEGIVGKLCYISQVLVSCVFVLKAYSYHG